MKSLPKIIEIRYF